MPWACPVGLWFTSVPFKCLVNTKYFSSSRLYSTTLRFTTTSLSTTSELGEWVEVPRERWMTVTPLSTSRLADSVTEDGLTSRQAVEFDDISPACLCKENKLHICSLLSLAVYKYYQITTCSVLAMKMNWMSSLKRTKTCWKTTLIWKCALPNRTEGEMWESDLSMLNAVFSPDMSWAVQWVCIWARLTLT